MLILIWCGALCSFTDPSLWLLHSRSPPAPPPQMIVSTRALLSVRLYVPQSVHAGWPLPTTSFCSVWLPCPPFLLSNASSFICHVFLSFSRCLSLLFFVHLLSFPWPPQWSVYRGGCSMVHFLLDLDKALFRFPPQWNFQSDVRPTYDCQPLPLLILLEATLFRSQSGVRGRSVIWVTLAGFRWSTLPVSVTCLKPLLCGLLLASDLHLSSRASLFSLCRHYSVNLSWYLVFRVVVPKLARSNAEVSYWCLFWLIVRLENFLYLTPEKSILTI